jgi:hypothetical protein
MAAHDFTLDRWAFSSATLLRNAIASGSLNMVFSKEELILLIRSVTSLTPDTRPEFFYIDAIMEL